MDFITFYQTNKSGPELVCIYFECSCKLCPIEGRHNKQAFEMSLLPNNQWVCLKMTLCRQSKQNLTTAGLQSVSLTMALHQRQRQSCSRLTLPQFLSHTTHLALTGRFPSSHWWGINTWNNRVQTRHYCSSLSHFCTKTVGTVEEWKRRARRLLLTPSSSSTMSFPMEASVVHLQLLVERTAQRLWALNLQTVEDKSASSTLKWDGDVRKLPQ